MPASNIRDIRSELRLVYLPQALVFINHLLAVASANRSDPRLQLAINRGGLPVLPFVAHFVAKHVILNGSTVGSRRLDWPLFRRVVDLYFDLDDPIATAPEWKHRDPTGFLERLLAQQLPSQNVIPIREYGLTYALFGARGPQLNLRSECERALGMTLEQFLLFGFLCMVATSVPRNRAAITYDRLSAAFASGIAVAVPEIWERFLARVACTPERFREVSANAAVDEPYAACEFNPLLQHPLIEVGTGRFYAPDPQLLVTRTYLFSGDTK